MCAMKRLGICLLNISEGRNAQVVEAVATAAVSTAREVPASDADLGLHCKSTVLNIFSDYDYNRSVLTIAAPLHHLSDSVYNACREAYGRIDLGDQHGVHPRLGAVDLLPIYPLSEDVSVGECGVIAKGIASNLARDIPGTSFFLFGSSDVPKNIDLVARRKQVGWFLGKHQMDYGSLQHDLGSSPSPRYGLTGAGGSLYVTNYNVSIATGDVSIGHEIAGRIRSTTPGGLPGVRVMAFAHEGTVEIACNVENVPMENAKDAAHSEQAESTISTGTRPHDSGVCPQQDTYHSVRYTTPSKIEARVKELASAHGVGLVGTSIIGFTPQEAQELAVHALQTGQVDFWRTRVPGAMM
ncbi:glutamate formimidoyltransferase-like [Patiria miniata]|uniref:Formiminotransferase N-terminal subdomain domain-containing protein n=1 Tax=Patiria miniata TaxID=46514 RepID=A0A914ALD8_PATMI|nr:glutamate formimidoyltransferase-like [Patiria miniata]